MSLCRPNRDSLHVDDKDARSKRFDIDSKMWYNERYAKLHQQQEVVMIKGKNNKAMHCISVKNPWGG